MDYRELLMKYIAHVGACEGVTFIESDRGLSPHLTSDEWVELERLDQEARKYKYLLDT